MCKLCKKIFCCKCCSRPSPLQTITNHTRLLPKNQETASLLESQELLIFGSVPKEMTQIYLNAETFGQNPIKKIACGKSHCLILMRNGRIYVFGDNDQGQLGLPLVMKTISNLTQVEVIGGNQEDIEDIACGDYFSLVLVRGEEGKRVVRFGISEREMYLNNSQIPTQNNVTLPENIPEITKIFAFEKRSILVTATNHIYVGGISFKDVEIEKYELLSSFNAGIRSLHLLKNGCVIVDNRGRLFGIGDNTYYELGETEHSLDNFKMLPYEFKGVKKVSNGARHLLILLENGELLCLGDNSDHQCFAKTSNCKVPTKVEIDKNSKVIDCYSGYNHNLVILEDGSVLTWGNSSNGKLGYPDDKFNEEIPQEVVDLKIKNINYVYLSEQMTIISVGKELDAIVLAQENNNIERNK